MRLFFAAWPSSRVRHQLESATAALQLGPEARSVCAGNYHLTVAFAGEISNARATALRSAAASLRPTAFEIQLTAYEYWPKPAVVVIAADRQPTELTELRGLLCIEFERLGISTESHSFRPHVTLARKVMQAPVFKPMPGIPWSVNAFQLVRSSRSATGSIYTVVDQWPLLDNGSREG
jgi:RNA 2',3'-cyclic 3'-phosphodiesterase